MGGGRAHPRRRAIRWPRERIRLVQGMPGDPSALPPEAAHVIVPAGARVYLLLAAPNVAGPEGPIDVPGWERRYVFPAEPEADP